MPSSPCFLSLGACYRAVLSVFSLFRGLLLDHSVRAFPLWGLVAFSLWGPVTVPSSPCFFSLGACYSAILSAFSIFGGLLQYHPLRVFSLWGLLQGHPLRIFYLRGPITVPSSPCFLSLGTVTVPSSPRFLSFGACYSAILSVFSLFRGLLQCHPFRVFSLCGPVTESSCPCFLSLGACYRVILSVLSLMEFIPFTCRRAPYINRASTAPPPPPQPPTLSPSALDYIEERRCSSVQGRQLLVHRAATKGIVVLNSQWVVGIRTTALKLPSR